MTEPNSTPYRIDLEYVNKLMSDIETSHAQRGTVPFTSPEKQRALIMMLLAPVDPFELILENISAIENYAQYRFTTSDGRTFGIFYDGVRILGLLEAERVHINHRDKAGVERIRSLDGFIVEIGSDDPPLIFESEVDLANTWEGLHVSHGVPISEEETDYLNVMLEGQQGLSIDPIAGSDDGGEDD